MGDYRPPPPRVSLPGVGDIVMERYRVERFVGSGGMAHVLGARHVSLGNEVAIKVLDPTLANDGEARERFAREARAMASLSNKHTVRVFDVGALPSGLPFMVMELLDGRDLHRELNDRGPLPIEEAIDYIDQACEAVAEAHAAGIIHRDLKPQNLFLTRTKEGPLIRVLDFGIARTIKGGSQPKLETITRLGDVVGTLHYMAPEQIRNSASVEPRSDIWSLGACLYKLVTGFPPFPQAGEAPLMSAILTLPPKPIGEHRADVPAILSSVIMRCLRKPPEERFTTALELRKALGEAADLLATSEFSEKTEMMQKIEDADGDVPRSAGRRVLSKTMPLSAQMAKDLMAASFDKAKPSTRALPQQPQPQQHQQPSQQPPPSSPSLPGSGSRPSFPMIPPGAPYQPQAAQPTNLRHSQAGPYLPPQPQKSSGSLSFIAIVAAVAVGVFLAGIALLFVLSRR